jgi:hypothetical protein
MVKKSLIEPICMRIAIVTGKHETFCYSAISLLSRIPNLLQSIEHFWGIYLDREKPCGTSTWKEG